MNTDLTVTGNAPADTIIEQVVMAGDLSKLSPQQRVAYYTATCKSLGLNPLTRPFDYINLSGKLTLYAKRDATDQLRRINGVSITRLERERIEDIYTVTAYASDTSGRTDSSIGAVNIAGLKGDPLANALMKAETKAKRRVTLSIVGLGWLDETEIETIPDARPVASTVVEGVIVHDAAAEFASIPSAQQERKAEPVKEDGKGVPAQLGPGVLPAFDATAAEFVKVYPRYKTKDGKPDRFHLLMAAGKCGWKLIQAEHIEEVFAQIADRAEAQDNPQPELVEA